MSDSTDRILRRISKLAGFAERLEEERRIEVIRLARVLAIAGLPKRQVDASHLSRTLRVGAATWLRVTYSVDEGAPLPYGADRFVLAGIQHLALEQDSRTVLFNRVGELLHTFGLSQDGRSDSCGSDSSGSRGCRSGCGLVGRWLSSMMPTSVSSSSSSGGTPCRQVESFGS